MNTLFSLCLILQILFPTTSIGQAETNPSDIDWKSWEEGTKAMEQDKKIGLVLMAKEECSLTAYLEKTSLADAAVTEILSDRFVPILLTTPSSTLQSKSQFLSFLHEGPELPPSIQRMRSNQKLNSPTLIVIDENLRTLQSFSGYIKAERLHEILIYFGQGHYKKTPWEKFLKALHNQ